jgi:HAD superfamily phosphoserine phosphatase-like hydrolase
MDIDVYDFDKTIYRGDSSLHFYFYCLKKCPKTLLYVPYQLINFVPYLLGIYNKTEFKEKFYCYLKAIKDIDRLVDSFWSINEGKIHRWYVLKKHNKEVVISASPEFLLKPICEKLKIMLLIGSKVDKRNGHYTGENCFGEEKVKRLNQRLKDYVIKEFYSDSLTDAPLARLGEKSFIVDKESLTIWEEYKPTGIKKLKAIFYSRDFLYFLAIGIINTVNGTIFAYLYSLIFNVNAAFMAGYLTSLTISYFLNSFITFRSSLTPLKYIKFCISYIPNFIIQNLAVILFYNLFGWHKLIAYLLAAIIGIPVTFLLMKFFAFKKK